MIKTNDMEELKLLAETFEKLAEQEKEKTKGNSLQTLVHSGAATAYLRAAGKIWKIINEKKLATLN